MFIYPFRLIFTDTHIKTCDMRLIIILAMAVSLSISSCTESNNSEEDTQSETTENIEEMQTPSAPKAMLINGEWETNYIMNAPKTLDELYPKSKPTITLNAEDGMVSGNSGCNNFRGTIEVDGNTLSWGELASTRKMCPDMQGEILFLETLKKGKTYSVTENGQTLNLILGDLGIMRLNKVR